MLKMSANWLRIAKNCARAAARTEYDENTVGLLVLCIECLWKGERAKKDEARWEREKQMREDS